MSSNAAKSSQKVTLPYLPDLLNPNYLDSLLPPSEDEIARRAQDDGFTLFEDLDDTETIAGSTTTDPTVVASPKNDEKKNQLIDLLKATSDPNRTRTENNARALASTLSATLDAFNQLGGYTKSEDVEELLTKSWEEDKDITLRIIWNLRSIVDGMGERETFYQAFGWLYKNHPRTAIGNLHLLVDPVCERTERARKPKKGEAGSGDADAAKDAMAVDPALEEPKPVTELPHGYWKDLLNILALASLDQISGNVKQAAFLHTPRGKKAKGTTQLDKDTAKARKKDKLVGLHDGLISRLESDAAVDIKFKALYITVARLFSQRLVEDLKITAQVLALKTESENLQREANPERYDALTEQIFALSKTISLAGKWAPTPNCAHDKVTKISTAISFLIYQSSHFAPGSYPSSLPSASSFATDGGIATILSNPAHCATLRSFYQRWVLTPLREVKRVPESLMCANKWTSINYSQIPSKAMALHTPTFFKHNQEGFLAYLKQVEKGTRTISGATMYPHELVGQAFALGQEAKSKDKKNPAGPLLAQAQLRVVEAQWKTLVESIKAEGTLDSCLAICDVSGSMGSTYGISKSANLRDKPEPIVVALALSTILASVAEPPFKGIITFSQEPEYVPLDQDVENKSLYETLVKIQKTPWGYNTNFLKVFNDLILPLAIANNLPKDQMIKRLFVFSDMQFDEASRQDVYSSTPRDAGEALTKWETTYDLIEKAYNAAGYDVPQMVFWNLAGVHGGKQTVEVTADRKGVAMMTGFSPALLKVFMEKKEITPEDWEMVNDAPAAEESAASAGGGDAMDTDSKEVEKTEKEKGTPLSVMKDTLTRKSYSALRVFD